MKIDFGSSNVFLTDNVATSPLIDTIKTELLG